MDVGLCDAEIAYDVDLVTGYRGIFWSSSRVDPQITLPTQNDFLLGYSIVMSLVLIFLDEIFDAVDRASTLVCFIDMVEEVNTVCHNLYSLNYKCPNKRVVSQMVSELFSSSAVLYTNKIPISCLYSDLIWTSITWNKTSATFA